MSISLLYGLGALFGGAIGHLYNQKGMLVWPSRAASRVWNLGVFYEILIGLGAAIGLLAFMEGFELNPAEMEQSAWLGLGFIAGFGGPALIGTLKSKLDLFWPLENRGVGHQIKEINDLSKQLATQVAPDEDHTPLAGVLTEKVGELQKMMQDVERKTSK